MELGRLAERLDDTLRTDAYADLDASANGLQVGDRDHAVDRVVVAVDAAMETIETAAGADADAMVVHHGLSWGGIERVTGRTYERLNALIEANIGLYVSHLPLDGHPTLGNAAGVADVLGLAEREPFGAVGPETIGLHGILPEPTPSERIVENLDSALDTGGETVRVLDHGPELLGDIAIVTGAGADYIDDAVDVGVDALITGEAQGRAYHESRESGLTVFFAGHYATETFGVRNLGTLLEEWGLEVKAVDHPTGL